MSANLNPHQWARLEELFGEYSSQNAQTRELALKKLRESEPELARELTALLEHDLEIQQFESHISESTSKSSLDGHRYRIDQTVNGYKLLFPTNTGGQSEVWCAQRQTELIAGLEHNRFAVKFLDASDRASKSKSKSRTTRFKQEVELLSRLEHPNIAPLVDSGVTEDGNLYLVTPWIEGFNLCHYCDHNQSTVKERVRLLLKIFDAVTYAHRSLIVHRDVKPQNILVDEMGSPMLLDFGIAKLVDIETLNDTDRDSKVLTQTMERPMTLAYSSPEQIKSEPITTSTDVYLCGLVAYELLTGHHPYSEIAQPELTNFFDRVVSGDSISPSTIVKRDAVPLISGPTTPTRINAQLNAGWRKSTPENLAGTFRGGLDAILLRAINKSPDQRFASVSDFAQDLENWLNNKPIATRANSFSIRQAIQRRPLTSVVTGILVTIGLGLFALSWLMQSLAASGKAQLANETRITEQSDKIDELLGVQPGRDRIVAEIGHSLAMNKIDQAGKLIESFEVDECELAIEDRLAFAKACLECRKISKGLSAFSDFRTEGPASLSDFDVKTQYQVRIVLSKLLLEADWPYAAFNWIEIPKADQGIDFDVVAKLMALELVAAARTGHFDLVEKRLPQVRAPKNWYELDQNEMGMVTLAQAELLGEQGKWNEANKLLAIDSNLTDGPGPNSLWYAEALVLSSTNGGLESSDVELLLRRANDALNESRHHSKTAGVCIRLAKFYSNLENTKETNDWLSRAASQIKQNSEWGTLPAADLISLQADSEPPVDDSELIYGLNRSEPFRIVNRHYPYINAALADEHLRLALKLGKHDQANRVAQEMRRWHNETDPVDEVYLLMSFVGERMSSGSNATSEINKEIERLYDSLLGKHKGPARSFLKTAQDKQAHTSQTEMDWLRSFLNYRDAEEAFQLNAIMHLAEKHLEDDEYVSRLLTGAAKQYVEPESDPPGDDLLKWYRLVALQGDVSSIEAVLQDRLKNGSVEVKDRCAEVLIIGLVRSDRVSEAMSKSKTLMDLHAPDVTRLRASIWDCGQWLKSINHELADDWSK